MIHVCRLKRRKNNKNFHLYFFLFLVFMMVLRSVVFCFGQAAQKWPSSSAWNIFIKHSTDFPFVFASPNANNSIRASIIHHFLCLLKMILHVDFPLDFALHSLHTGHQCLIYVKKCKFSTYSPFAIRPFSSLYSSSMNEVAQFTVWNINVNVL